MALGSIGGSTMVANIVFRVTNLASREFNNLQRDYTTAAANMESTTARINAAANGLGSFAVRAGVLGGIIAGVTGAAAAQFQGLEAHIDAFTTIHGTELEKMSNQAKEFAVKYGVNLMDIEKGLYSLASSGLHGAQAITALRLGTEAAAASGAKEKDVLSAITSVIKAYGVSTQETAKYINIMTQGVIAGKMEWNDLAKAIGTALPIASQMHVKFEELVASIAAMTNAGISTRQAAQDINASLRNMVAPGNQQIRVAKLLGLNWRELYNVHGNGLARTFLMLAQASKAHAMSEEEAARVTGLHGTRISMLLEKLKETGDPLMRQARTMQLLTGGTISLNTALRLTSDQGLAEFKRSLQLTEQNAGATDKAFKAVAGTANVAFGQLRETLRVAAIDIGSILLPSLVNVAQALMPVVSGITKLAKAAPGLTTALVAGSAALLAFGVALKAYHFVLTTATQATGALTGVLEMMRLKQNKAVGDISMARLELDRETASINLQKAAIQERLLLDKQQELMDAGKIKRAQEMGVALQDVDDEMRAYAKAEREATYTTQEAANVGRQAQQAMHQLSDATLTTLSLKEKLAAQDIVITNAEKAYTQATTYMTVAQQEAAAALDITTKAQARYDAAVLAAGGSNDRRLRVVKERAAAEAALKTAITNSTAAEDAASTVATMAATKQTELNDARAKSVLIAKQVAAEDVKVAAASTILTDADERQVAAQRQVAASMEEQRVASINLNTTLKAGAVAAYDAAAGFFAIDVAMGPIVAPLWLIVAAIAAVAGAFLLAYNNVKWFHDGVQKAIAEVGQFIAAFWDKTRAIFYLLGDLLGFVGTQFGNFLAMIGGLFESTGNSTSTAEKAMTAFKLALVILTGPFGVIIGLVLKILDKLGLLAKALHAVGDAGGWLADKFGALGNKLHGVTAEHDKAEKAAAKHTQTLKTQQKQLEMMAAEKFGIGKYAGAWKKALQTIDQSIAGMDQAVKDYATSLQGEVVLMDNKSKAMVESAKTAHHGVLTWLKALAHDAPAVIAAMKFPALHIPIAVPDYTKLQATKVAGDKNTSQTLASGDISQATKKIFADMTAAMNNLGKMPKDLQVAGKAMVKEQEKSLKAAHNEYIAKLNRENQRHADALNKINSKYHDTLKSLYSDEQTKLRQLHSDYLTKLKNLNDDNAQKVAQYLSKQVLNQSTFSAQFTAKMTELQSKMKSIQDGANAAMDRVRAKMASDLQKHNGAFDGTIRKEIKDRAAQDLKHIKDLEASHMKTVNDDIQRISKAYEAQSGKTRTEVNGWLERNKQNLEHHVRGLNENTDRQIRGIQSETNRRATAAQTRHANDARDENARWVRHIADMKAAFDKHVKGMDAAFKKVNSAGGWFDALKSKADELAHKSLSALALAIETGKGDIKALAAEAKKAANDAKGMADALVKAGKLIGDKAKSLAASLDATKKKLDADVNKALNKFVYDTIHHTGSVEKDKQALDKAAAAQGAYNKVVAQGQKIIDDNNKAAKDTRHPKKEKAPDLTPFQTALNKVTKTMDTRLSEATNALILHYYNGSVSLDTATKLMDKSATEQLKMEHAKALADDAAAKAQLAAAVKMKDLNKVYDLTKQKVNNDLNKAIHAAAVEFMNTGKISAATAANLQKLQVDSDAYDKAEKAATDAAKGVDKSFSALKTKIEETATTAMDKYTQALYEQTQGITHSAAEMQALQQAAYSASQQSAALAASEKKAKDAIDQMTLANTKGISAALELAKAKQAEAVAAYEDAIWAGTYTPEALKKLHDSALLATEAVVQLEKTIKDVTDGLTSEADSALGIDDTTGPTPYQQFEEGIQEQRLQDQEAQNAFKDNLATQKEQLAEQKAANSSAKQDRQTSNDLQKQLLDEAKKTNQYQAEIIAAQQKMIYLGALGINRASVTGTDYTQFLNRWASDSSANPGLPT